MNKVFASVFAIVLYFVLSGSIPKESAASNPSAEPPKDFTDFDLGKLAIAPVGPKTETKTGFVVGGTNPTSLIKTVYTRGIQPSPFKDGTESGSCATVRNLDNGKTLTYGLLLPYMIERYGFYEGKGTSYRLEPHDVVEVFDFLH
jgi:hypothetical protein